jgi:cbb3-type cytochrome oxidase subunit 3
MIEAILDAGFVFWGLFLAFGIILVAYLVWMYRSEGKETRR